jgi:hypothetical protein
MPCWNKNWAVTSKIMKSRKPCGSNLGELDKIKGLSSISFISFEEMGYSESNDKGRLLKYLADDQMDALAFTNLNELKAALAKRHRAASRKRETGFVALLLR